MTCGVMIEAGCFGEEDDLLARVKYKVMVAAAKTGKVLRMM